MMQFPMMHHCAAQHMWDAVTELRDLPLCADGVCVQLMRGVTNPPLVWSVVSSHQNNHNVCPNLWSLLQLCRLIANQLIFMSKAGLRMS